MSATPPEVTAPVELVGPDGRLNSDAVGWSRRPLHATSGIKGGLRGLGRNKRWEYCLVMTAEILASLTISDIDYAGVHTVWAYEIASRRRVDHTAVASLAAGGALPRSLGMCTSRARTKKLNGRIIEAGRGTRIQAEAAAFGLG